MPDCKSPRLATIPRIVAVAMLTLPLISCGGGGGGGGGGSSNDGPTAAFTATPPGGVAPLAVAFDGSASSDSDGSIASYSWTFGDGATATGATTNHTYAEAGTYQVSLTVRDDDGATDNETRTIVVDANEAPVAVVSYASACSVAPATVAFDGTRSWDDDGQITNYAWNFGDGTTGTGATPQKAYANGGTYTVTLTVTDSSGDTSQSSRAVTVLKGPGNGATALTGQLTFERVPFSASLSGGLNYSATTAVPVRHVVVELLGSDGSLLASVLSDESGNYAFNAPANTSVRVRAKAQTCNPAPAWDVRVLDNAGGDALFVLDTALFQTGTTPLVRNLLADSGWPDLNGTHYATTRASGPFAILDSIRSGVAFLQTAAGAGLDLPPLDAFWSPENRTSTTWNPASGLIGAGTQFVSVGNVGYTAGMYVLGDDGVDTDEFDQHVIVHEFMHFLEDAISRTESMGGSHSTGERLDMRLAFSEGFANAFAGMVLGSPVYRDSFGTSQADSFNLDFENDAHPPAGWYNEGSVIAIVWDLFDAAQDGQDQVQLGFAPMLDALRNELRNGPALVSLYPFVAALKADAGAPTAQIDALVRAQQVFGTGAYGAGETNDGGGLIAEALPIYTDITVGASRRVCGSTDAGTYNKAGNRVFLKFSLAATRNVDITAAYTATGSATGGPTPDPDIVLYRNGFLASAQSAAANTETLSRTLAAGDYVIEVYEYSHVDPATDAQRRGVTCMNVSIS